MKSGVSSACRFWILLLLLTCCFPVVAEQQPPAYPKITLPWEFLGEQPDKSYRIINRIGDAVAAIDYHPIDDLWLLSLSKETHDQHFSRLNAVNIYIRGEGFLSMESPLECSDCIEIDGSTSTIYVPLTDDDLQLLREGFYADFHYDKVGVPDEENGFVFRVGLIETRAQIDRITASVPAPVPLQAAEFNRGHIWLLRYHGLFRKSVRLDSVQQPGILRMKQKENKNWYSGISYDEQLPRWSYVVRELEEGEEILVLVKR